MKNGTPLHRLWWHCSDNGLSWLWRPYCWTRGDHVPHHCDVYFELCVFCGKPLWSKRRDGTPNPFYVDGRPVKRAPIRWRRHQKTRSGAA